jgi:hypothetical protein
MENMINLGINADMVKPIIEKQIQAAIMANIGNPEELISKTVALAMRQKVDSKGHISNYSSDNRYDYLEVLTGNAIREAAKEALQEWLKDNQQLVKKMVIKEMNRPERQKSLVGAFVNAVEDSLNCSWRFYCDVHFKEDDE